MISRRCSEDDKRFHTTAKLGKSSCETVTLQRQMTQNTRNPHLAENGID